MPALIRRPRAPGKLQAAALKADETIQKLKESDADPEAVAVLVAHYEELKKRHQRLKDLKKSRSETSQSDEEPPTTELQENKDEDEQTPTQKVHIDQLEDGTFKFTLPSSEAGGKSEVYILNSEDYDRENPIYNILITANEVIRMAVKTIANHMQLLQRSHKAFLTNAQKSLLAQKNRLDLLLENEGSPMAIEIAAKLYLNDALGYVWRCQLMLHVLGVKFDADGSDMGESELFQSRFYLIKQTDSEDALI
ncbi:hypothetical protein C0995_013494 [Termitomyces sp. Mi166|nr:hypothetical protein C0995_013494 [Termitomyces sp. Mi166\